MFEVRIIRPARNINIHMSIINVYYNIYSIMELLIHYIYFKSQNNDNVTYII
jgi:hypothetical protein